MKREKEGYDISERADNYLNNPETWAWRDALTGRESISLGAERYQQLLDSAGLNAVGELYDEENHYYLVAKPPGTGPS